MVRFSLDRNCDVFRRVLATLHSWFLLASAHYGLLLVAGAASASTVIALDLFGLVIVAPAAAPWVLGGLVIAGVVRSRRSRTPVNAQSVANLD